MQLEKVRARLGPLPPLTACFGVAGTRASRGQGDFVSSAVEITQLLQ